MASYKVLSWHLLGGTEEAQKKLNQDSYWVASKYKPGSLLLEPTCLVPLWKTCFQLNSLLFAFNSPEASY
jgi:hypothetical protein